MRNIIIFNNVLYVKKKYKTSFFFIYFIGDMMDKLLVVAYEEMMDMKQPYVGTEHFLLAFLKLYGCNLLSYDDYKSHIIKVIGCSHSKSEYKLYTPILRYVSNNFNNELDAINYILSNDDSIAYNLLLTMNINPQEILNDISIF